MHMHIHNTIIILFTCTRTLPPPPPFSHTHTHTSIRRWGLLYVHNLYTDISTISCSRFNLSPMHMQRLPHHLLSAQLNGHGSWGLGMGLAQQSQSHGMPHPSTKRKKGLVTKSGCIHQIRNFEAL